MRTPTPRRLWNYLTRRLRLKRYLQSPGDGRRQPQIAAQALLWAMLVGQILREYSFHAVEALVRSSARRHLCLRVSFGDDALGYFTERLDPAPMRAALAAILPQAKRNKAFDGWRLIGLAVDGAAGGGRRRRGWPLCRPIRNAAREGGGYLRPFPLIRVV